MLICVQLSWYIDCESFQASPRESFIHSLKVSVIIIILILCSFVTSAKFLISLLIMPTFFLSWANLLHKAAVAGLLDSLFIFVCFVCLFIFVSILLTFKTSSCSSLWIEGFYLILSDISYKNSGHLLIHNFLDSFDFGAVTK